MRPTSAATNTAAARAQRPATTAAAAASAAAESAPGALRQPPPGLPAPTDAELRRAAALLSPSIQRYFWPISTVLVSKGRELLARLHHHIRCEEANVGLGGEVAAEAAQRAALEEMIPVLHRHVQLCQHYEKIDQDERVATKIASVLTVGVLLFVCLLAWWLTQPGAVGTAEEFVWGVVDFFTPKDYGSKAYYRAEDGAHYNYYE